MRWASTFTYRLFELSLRSGRRLNQQGFSFDTHNAHTLPCLGPIPWDDIALLTQDHNEIPLCIRPTYYKGSTNNILPFRYQY